MHNIMSELHQDHIHLARLLNILDEQVGVLANEGDPDLLLMIDITEYIQQYPDIVHHPKEDHVYEYFTTKTNDASDIVETLMKEHQHLPLVTNEFMDLLQGAAYGGVIVSRDELIQKIQHFIALERTHMNAEELTLFPLINKTLSEQDWAVIEKSMPEKDDPLFGEKIEKCYENLYRVIENE